MEQPDACGLTKITFKVRIGEMLLSSGIIDKQQLNKALEIQNKLKDQGKSKLFGDIISEEYGVLKSKIENVFAKNLIYALSQIFKETLQKEAATLDESDKVKEMIDKIDIFIPKWEMNTVEEERKCINAEMTVLINSEEDSPITVNIPFTYVLGDQIADIDIYSATEIVKSELIKNEELMIGIDLSKIGIQIPDADAEEGFKILFVDDDRNQRSLIKRLMARMGHKVKTAGDGVKALDMMDSEAFQLTITDLQMPEMDGINLCREIKAKNPKAIVYALSGYITDFGMDSLENAGFDGFLYKPVSLNELKELVENVLEKIHSDSPPDTK